MGRRWAGGGPGSTVSATLQWVQRLLLPVPPPALSAAAPDTCCCLPARPPACRRRRVPASSWCPWLPACWGWSRACRVRPWPQALLRSSGMSSSEWEWGGGLLALGKEE